MPGEPDASDPAYEIVGDPADGGPFVLTCEHASRRLPEWQAEPDDLPLLEDHWGSDLGAADLTRALIGLTRSCGVLSRYSRLVCDANRDPAESSFVVEEAEGHRLSFNRGMDAAERQRRRRRYFDPYHEAIDQVLRTRTRLGPPVRLCAIHSFTPRVQGRVRRMEVGVLFDAWAEPAARLRRALITEGFTVALNAPYSGRDGLIYSAHRHGIAHGLEYLELEVRQDLIDTPAKVPAVATRVARGLAGYAR